jgi:2-keto-4-pentenoate hydratase/2-oxohepta-3-ene-1,7-dioic acid hydratase in catechol pathway
MRICRIQHQGRVHPAIYHDKFLVPLAAGAKAYADATHEKIDLPSGDDLLAFLPPDGKACESVKKLAEWVERNGEGVPAAARLSHTEAKVLVPIPRPNKLFLLAGNYGDHIREGGGIAPERLETFPYVFMKPPSTTLTNPGDPVQVPSVSPNAIDWELELAIVIGRGGKHIKEADALEYVAGYTVINDISDRKFRPNPQRKERPKDSFFDWLHGKWHDSFCPCGPCITSADAIPDPQKLKMQLRLNDEVKQDATTALQIFPVAAVIEFISSFVTLEPGDIISTGTPSGVGAASNTFVKPGDTLTATIEHIGSIVSPIVAEKT